MKTRQLKKWQILIFGLIITLSVRTTFSCIQNNKILEGTIILIIGLSISTTLFYVFQKSAEKEEENQN